MSTAGLPRSERCRRSQPHWWLEKSVSGKCSCVMLRGSSLGAPLRTCLRFLRKVQADRSARPNRMAFSGTCHQPSDVPKSNTKTGVAERCHVVTLNS
eukprot:2077772-Rhodomonas_salina.1